MIYITIIIIITIELPEYGSLRKDNLVSRIKTAFSISFTFWNPRLCFTREGHAFTILQSKNREKI